mmetsp:Transcript_40249/g.82373  ORF Transcript_40249/g.82373 Transcript_40249/m.82373 type:complete len:335 (-) Transcript_40249:831-1835(-)
MEAFVNMGGAFLKKSLPTLKKFSKTNKFLTPKLKKKSVNYSTRKINLFCAIKGGDNLNSEIWEIDFFSRPVLNKDGKRLWELIIVNKDQTFEHIEEIPNNLINSKELRKRINYQISLAKKKPNIVKFFRSQMFNMINIALSELDVAIKPSRKTYSLFKTINEREENVYPKMEGYKPFMRDFQSYQSLKKTPERMPDALRGEKYLFASVESTGINQILVKTPAFYDSYTSLDNLPTEKTIPGVIIFSERSRSLSSWLDSIELFSLDCDIEQKNLCIDCGLDTQYLFAKLSQEQIKEAKAFQNEKNKLKGLHFIAIQKSVEKTEIDGFWLLNSNNT